MKSDFIIMLYLTLADDEAENYDRYVLSKE